MIKKILATIGLLALLALPVEAMGMGGVGGGISSPQYWKLNGTALTPIVASWTVSVPAGISFGASTMTGNLNMGDYDITGADQIIGTTALDLESLSGGNITINPHTTGIVKLGDTALASLSSLSTNGTLAYDLEVLNNLFTGGITMATNGGDVPFMDRSVTSASAVGTAQSYPILIDGQFILTPYSESDGAGGLQNKEVRTVAIRNYGRLNNTQGVAVASDTNIVLTTGNVFEITGTTKIDLISNLGWQEGAEVTLVCNEDVTFDNGTASSGTDITMFLAGGSDFACTAKDTLKLMLLSTTAGGQAWHETGRSAN